MHIYTYELYRGKCFVYIVYKQQYLSRERHNDLNIIEEKELFVFACMNNFESNDFGKSEPLIKFQCCHSSTDSRLLIVFRFNMPC